jgi:hypothetical protein
VTPGEQRRARIAQLTPEQAASALTYLSGYAPHGFDQALDRELGLPDRPVPLWPVYLTPVPDPGPEPLGQVWFCADCGADGALVPLVEHAGIFLCNESRQCLARRAAREGA